MKFVNLSTQGVYYGETRASTSTRDHEGDSLWSPFIEKSKAHNPFINVFCHIQEICNNISMNWINNCEIYLVFKGFFTIQFHNLDDYRKVFKDGP